MQNVCPRYKKHGSSNHSFPQVGHSSEFTYEITIVYILFVYKNIEQIGKFFFNDI